MLILLPPSETKKQDEPGAFGVPGAAPANLLEALAFPELTEVRSRLLGDLEALCADPAAAAAALKLGPKLAGESALNLDLRRAPRLSAIDRYTGVLFDALDAATLSPASRAYAGETLLIQTAPFGPVGALDPLPNYRLSAAGRVPPVALKKRWAAEGSAALASRPGFALDLRSEAYAALAPLPRGSGGYLRVVSAPAPGGTEPGRALNHFNKRTKGLLTRALLEDRVALAGPAEFVEWAASRGFRARARNGDLLFEELR